MNCEMKCRKRERTQQRSRITSGQLSGCVLAARAWNHLGGGAHLRGLKKAAFAALNCSSTGHTHPQEVWPTQLPRQHNHNHNHKRSTMRYATGAKVARLRQRGNTRQRDDSSLGGGW